MNFDYGYELSIEQYLSGLKNNLRPCSEARVVKSLQNIEQIIITYISRYGIEQLYNGHGEIDKDGVYAVGKVLNLEGSLSEVPSPITINKHLEFIKLLVRTYEER